MIAAMQAGRAMIVRSRNEEGRDVSDIVSLLGFTAANDAAREACR